MDWIPLVAGLAGLAFAIVALARASGAKAAVEDARREAQRRVSAVEEQTNAELETQRKLLAKIAAGVSMTAEMIESGQLWQDVDGPAAKAKRYVEIGLVGIDFSSRISPTLALCASSLAATAKPPRVRSRRQ